MSIEQSSADRTSALSSKGGRNAKVIAKSSIDRHSIGSVCSTIGTQAPPLVALNNDREKHEYFDEPEVLHYKVERLAELIKKSRSMVAFTGAGISTAAGIPDYRSSQHTIVETGPGAQERLLTIQYKKRKEMLTIFQQQFNDAARHAYPTRAHMALKELIDRGYVKTIISQNTDGLHRKSQVSPENLYELHGNMNIKVCTKCQTKYAKSFTNLNEELDQNVILDNCTQNGCDGKLINSFVNYGDKLNPLVVQGAFEVAGRADLMLSLGSSYNATPANKIPHHMCWNGGKLVLVNLQKTSIDHTAEFVIYGRIQTVMSMLMDKLNMPIPVFKVKRLINITQQNDGLLMAKEALDGDELQTFIKEQFCQYNSKTGTYLLKLTFHGQYNENYVILEIPNALLVDNKSLLISLQCDPHGISNDKRHINFGLWQNVQLVDVLKSNGQPMKLKYRQGPYRSKKSLIQSYYAQKVMAGTRIPLLNKRKFESHQQIINNGCSHTLCTSEQDALMKKRPRRI